MGENFIYETTVILADVNSSSWETEMWLFSRNTLLMPGIPTQISSVDDTDLKWFK